MKYLARLIIPSFGTANHMPTIEPNQERIYLPMFARALSVAPLDEEVEPGMVRATHILGRAQPVRIRCMVFVRTGRMEPQGIERTKDGWEPQTMLCDYEYAGIEER